MKRSKVKNGLSINEKVELTEVGVKAVSVLAYFVQAIILIVLSLSIVYCFFSGMRVEISITGLYVAIVLSVAYFFVLFLLKKYLKFTLPITLLLYILAGFIWREELYAGFANVANSVLHLFNEYFSKSVNLLQYDITYLENGGNFFVNYISFLLIGFLCFVVLYGRNFLTYLIITVPVVFSSLLVGYVPSILPYIGYVAGTMGVIACIISERYSHTGRTVKARQPGSVLYSMNSSKVVVQALTIAAVLVLASLSYLFYSPTRYAEEFQAEVIRDTVDQKIDQILSGDLFKGTIFEGLTKKGASSGGLNKGKLNTTGKIRFNHETALKVTTVWGDFNTTNYLRGYVGDQYSSRAWTSLSEEDQQKLNELESNLIQSRNVESINSSLMNLLSDSQYQFNPCTKKTMEVENVNANDSVSYVPYNTQDIVRNQEGSLSSNDSKFILYDFGWNTGSGSPMSETFRNIDMMNVLKINMINSKIFEKYYDVAMDRNWSRNVKAEKQSSLSEMLNVEGSSIGHNTQSQLTIPIVDVYANARILGEELPLYVEKPMYILNMGNSISEFNEYAKEENAYFNYVKEVYTKLPEGELNKVKQLMAGYEVDVDSVNLQGENYSDISQLGTYDSVDETYQRVRERLAGVGGGEMTSPYLHVEEGNESIQSKYYDAIEYVRNYLAANTSYSLEPGKAPNDEDFVEYFLFTNKKGYCVHYASAATVMLRAMGVPARYVEGYVVTLDDYRSGKPVGTQTYETVDEIGNISNGSGNKIVIDIEDTNAHAWTEVYLPGMGWQPIEMTAPYVYQSNVEIPPINGNPDASLKPTPSISMTPRPTNTPKPTVKPTKTPGPTKKPTTKPSKAPTSGRRTGFFGGLRNWYDQLDGVVQKLLIILFMLIVTCIIVLLVIYIRCMIVHHHRKKKKRTLTDCDYVQYQYVLFTKMLHHFNIVYTTNQPYEEFVTELTEHFSFANEKELVSYYEIVLKTMFSQDNLYEGERQLCDRYYETFITGLYEAAGRKKRWVYKRLWII